MAATVRASYYGASATEPAGVTAETGIVFSRSDAKAPSAGTAPVPVPASAGTNYSWIMQLALEVTATAATALTNRKVAWASAVATGLAGYFGVQATYRQPASGNKPADNGTTNGATPTPGGAGAPGSYTALTTTAQTYDAASVSAGVTGRNGGFAELVGAVSNNFASGGGQAALPNLSVSYDEA